MNPHDKERNLLTPRFFGAAVAGLICIMMAAYFFYNLQPVHADATELKHFKIVRGEGLKDISARLSRDSFIKSIAVFKLYSLVSGRAQKFQPGVYELTQAMSTPQIVALLTAGGKNEVSVTIPEGYTMKDIQNVLEGAGVLTMAKLSDAPLSALEEQYPFLIGARSLEGFLFPDTYRFRIDSPLSEVLAIFLDNFSKKAWSLLEGVQGWYDILILASYLEREVPDFGDRQIVAGILLKRLKGGIPLQVDATVSYAKCGGAFKNCANLVVTRADLSIPSPYNTYERLGWTPTPIANPGQAAIRAALTPQVTSYWYYLSASTTKETVFSKTLEEHNRNRVKYL